MAVQEAPGVAQQVIAGEFQQPLAGFDIAGTGPLQLHLQNGGRFVAHGPRSLLFGRRVLRISLFESGACSIKIRFGDIPQDGCRRGNRWGGKATTLAPRSNNAIVWAAGTACVSFAGGHAIHAILTIFG
jgi:hypothetical protein